MDLEYNRDHQVVVCKSCQTCVGPSRKSIMTHLRTQPHRLTGQTLKSYLKYTDSLVLRSLQDLRDEKPAGKGLAIKHLKLWTGYHCLLCEAGDLLTPHLPRMRDHTVVHGKKAKEHEKEPLWEKWFLQSYFTTRSRVDYFVVIEAGAKAATRGSTIDLTLSQLEMDLFFKLEKHYRDVRTDLEEQASIVHDLLQGLPRVQ